MALLDWHIVLLVNLVGKEFYCKGSFVVLRANFVNLSAFKIQSWPQDSICGICLLHLQIMWNDLLTNYIFIGFLFETLIFLERSVYAILVKFLSCNQLGYFPIAALGFAWFVHPQSFSKSYMLISWLCHILQRFAKGNQVFFWSLNVCFWVLLDSLYIIWTILLYLLNNETEKWTFFSFLLMWIVRLRLFRLTLSLRLIRPSLNLWHIILLLCVL